MVTLTRPSSPADRSYLSVNWGNPVNQNHTLNKDLSVWWKNVPQFQGGTVLHDLMGRLDGVATGQYWQGPDERGLGSQLFDGGTGSERVTLPFSPVIDVTRTETFSIGMWVKPTIFAGQEFSVMLMWGLYRFSFGLADNSGAGDGKLECWFNNSVNINSDTALVAGVWSWVGMTTDGTTVTFYINDKADGTASHTAITDADDPLGIAGKHDGDAGSAYAGNVDDIRIYMGKKLSSDEMSRLYLASQPDNYELLNQMWAPQSSEQAEVSDGGGFAISRLHSPVSQSYLNVNWGNPINWNHALNKGRDAWWLNVPHFQGGTVLTELVDQNDGILTSMDPPTDWVSPFGRGSFGALDFDAIDDEVAIPAKDYLAKAMPFTLAFRMFIRTVPVSSGDGLFQFQTSDTTAGIVGFFLDSGGASYRFLNFGSRGGTGRFQQFHSAAAITSTYINTDLHLVITYDGVDETAASSFKMYLNGRDEPLEVGANFGAHGNNNVLGRNGTGSIFFDGQMDDVSVWGNRLFTPPEALDLFQLSQQGYPGVLRRMGLPQYSEQAAEIGDQVINMSPIVIPLIIPTTTVNGTGSAPITLSVPIAVPIVQPVHSVAGSGSAPVTVSPSTVPLVIPTHGVAPSGSAQITLSIPLTIPVSQPVHGVSGSGSTPVTLSTPLTVPVVFVTPSIEQTQVINISALTIPIGQPVHSVSGSGSTPVTLSTPLIVPIVQPVHGVAGSGSVSVTLSTPITMPILTPISIISIGVPSEQTITVASITIPLIIPVPGVSGSGSVPVTLSSPVVLPILVIPPTDLSLALPQVITLSTPLIIPVLIITPFIFKLTAMNIAISDTASSLLSIVDNSSADISINDELSSGLSISDV